MEYKEIFSILDYVPTSNLTMKFKATRKKMPVILQITPIHCEEETDLSDLSLCSGAFTEDEISTVSITFNLPDVLQSSYIEKLGESVLYRSRDCDFVTEKNTERCGSCENYLKRLRCQKDEESENYSKHETFLLKEEADDLEQYQFDNDYHDDDVGEESLGKEDEKLPKLKDDEDREIKTIISFSRVKKNMESISIRKKKRKPIIVPRKECLFCPGKFTQHKMIAHLKSDHADQVNNSLFKQMIEAISVIICQDCGKTFHSPSAHTFHQRTEHNAVFDFPCDKCEKTFKCKKNLTRHTELKHNVNYKDSVCPECGKTFANELKLSNHMKNGHGEKSKCAECGKIYPSKAILNAHVKKVHMNIGQKHQCLKCGKVYTKHGDLKSHMIVVHEGVKPYVCEVCGFKSTSMFNLNVHRKSHNLERMSPKEFRNMITSGNNPFCEKLDQNLIPIYNV